LSVHDQTESVFTIHRNAQSAAQSSELDRMHEQNQQLRGVTAEVLALASELRKGTIERVLAMSDLELGLQHLLGRQSSDRG
jgi:uncharacterized protein YhaN